MSNAPPKYDYNDVTRLSKPANEGERSRQNRLSGKLAPIEGMLFLGEAWTLYEAARLLMASHRDPMVVEIGSFKGRSSAALALGLLDRGAGRLYAIDPNHQPEFGPNLERSGVRDLVVVVRQGSHEARGQFDPSSVDLLFVDGSHEYKDVVQDVEDWTGALAEGAIVGFNDPGWTDVNKALRDTVARMRTPFRRPSFVDNTLFFEYRPSAPWSLADTAELLRLRAFLAIKLRQSEWGLALPKGIRRFARSAVRSVLR
ncbi:MAG: class I SAM-dependent methyltransferase [Candidatus Dormibacteraceae bacterium]